MIMEFLRSFLRRHLEGKPVVASPNVETLTKTFRFPVSLVLMHKLKPSLFKNKTNPEHKAKGEDVGGINLEPKNGQTFLVLK